MHRHRLPGAVLAVLATLVAAAPATAARHRVEVRRTAYGIPHVLAHDWGSLGYGYARAVAARPAARRRLGGRLRPCAEGRRDRPALQGQAVGAAGQADRRLAYVRTVELTRHGPRAQAILTYSQSEDRSSPHFDDQTKRFARDGWVRMPVTERAIRRDPQLKLTRLRG